MGTNCGRLTDRAESGTTCGTVQVNTDTLKQRKTKEQELYADKLCFIVREIRESVAELDALCKDADYDDDVYEYIYVVQQACAEEWVQNFYTETLTERQFDLLYDYYFGILTDLCDAIQEAKDAQVRRGMEYANASLDDMIAGMRGKGDAEEAFRHARRLTSGVFEPFAHLKEARKKMYGAADEDPQDIHQSADADCFSFPFPKRKPVATAKSEA